MKRSTEIAESSLWSVI